MIDDKTVNLVSDLVERCETKDKQIAALEKERAESKKVIEWQKLCIKEREKKLERAREALQIYSDFEKDQKPHWFIAREALKELS